MSEATAQALLDTAGRAAAAGRYATATALLASLETTEPPIDALLLRARMAAQQGQFNEAIDRFRAALLVEPNNREAREGLEKVRALKRWPAGRFRMRGHALLALGLALLLPTGLWLLVGTAERASSAREAVPPPEAAAVVATVSASIDPPATAPGEATVTEPPPLGRAPSFELEQPGVVVHRDGEQIVVVFEKGLFASGQTELTPEAATILRPLGQALRAQTSPLLVAVEGHTDEVPTAAGSPFRDNQALALARAVAVVEFLRMETGLPAEALSARGLGVTGAPYPLGGPSDRARNRTVVLRVGWGREG